MANLPVVITKAGLQPQSPANIQAQLLASVAATNPDYTANLPGSLVEDISSTDVAAIVECDSARVDTVNSLTPYGANDFLLNQIGQMLGIEIGQGSNTSVFVTFTSNSPGFVIGKGFEVNDGTYTYVIQDGGTISADGTSPLLFAIADVGGTWAVPPGTVNKISSSVPSSVTLTVVNPEPGLPGADDETAASYRSRVMTGTLAASQGMARYLKTLVDNIDGVQPRLIAAQKVGVGGSGGFRIIVGGGDPYQVAYAIYTALFNIANLVGSLLLADTITNALPSLVTTNLNHLLPVGTLINIAGALPIGYNGNFAVYSVPSQKTFVLGKPYNANNLSAQTWLAGVATWTTVSPHGVTIGSSFTIVGSTPTAYNGTYTAIAGTAGSTLKATKVVDPGASSILGQLSAGISLFDASGLAAYTSDTGVITPNFRNITVSLIDFPDTYPITFVNPPQQTTGVTCEWNTNSPNFVSSAAVAQLVVPAIVSYINSVFVGQPINILQLERAFEEAVADVLPAEFISKLQFSIAINGIPTSPPANSTLVSGDPEGYFFAQTGDIVVVQA